MKHKLLRGLAAACIAATLFIIPANAATIGGGTVDADALNLRADATTNSASKQLLADDTFVIVQSKVNDWYKVIVNGIEGYLKADYVEFSENLDGAVSTKAYIKGQTVRFRSGPGTSSSIIANYNSGTEVSVLGVYGAWYKVSIGETEGYVHSDYISFAKTESSSASSSTASSTGTLGEQIATYAQQYVGYNYTWGGKSPSTGFDCSGLCYYVYGQFNYKLSRVAQDMYNDNGTWVSKDNLQPGDLVFFGYSTSSIYHVGMYIGNGQYVHSSTYGVGVIISNLSGAKNYVGAKRIV